MRNRGETVETVSNFISGAPKSLQMVTAVMKFKNACSLEENLFVCISFFFLAPESLGTVTAALKLKDACSLEGKL